MSDTVDLCIVYDDDTKKQAKALYRKLSEKLIRCVCHDEKTYLDTDEKTNTNFNKVLFFSQSLIKENFMPEISTCTELVKGVSLISNGTAFGINVSISWLYALIPPVLDTYFEKKAKSKLYDKAVLCLVQDDNLSIIIPKKLDF